MRWAVVRFDNGHVGLFVLQKARVQLAHQQVSCHLEAEPTASHAGRDLEKVGYDTLVETPKAFSLDDLLDSIANSRILVPHATHGVDLESPPQNIKRVCDGLRDSTGDGTCS